jgi:hypothetical protein
MVSVLIPVYNYNIVALVKELHTQLIASKITFEIIAMDDFSRNQFLVENSEIDALSFTRLEKSTQNQGRTEVRQLLSIKARYDWLLFLDADVMPKNSNYIQSYLNLIPKNYDAIYGGFSYKPEAPRADKILRWKYGRSKEQIDCRIRNKTPYKIVISANFMIKKSVFELLNSNFSDNCYGYDNYFGALLKQRETTIFHINNEVYHLGIEPNDQFLKKTEEATDTLLKLYQNNKIKEHENSLLTVFISLEKYYFYYLLSYLYELFHTPMQKNLLSRKPSILVLQLYKISYMCFKFKLMKVT